MSCKWTNLVRTREDCMAEEPVENIYKVVGCTWVTTGSGWDITGLPEFVLDENGDPVTESYPSQYAGDPAVCTIPNYSSSGYVALSIQNKETGKLVPASDIDIVWHVVQVTGMFEFTPGNQGYTYDPPTLEGVTENTPPYPVLQLFCDNGPDESQAYNASYLVTATIDGVTIPDGDGEWAELRRPD